MRGQFKRHTKAEITVTGYRIMAGHLTG